MDLQILSAAQSALQKMQNCIYDLKETIGEDSCNDKKLTLQYLDAIFTLNAELRKALNIKNEISRAEKELRMTQLLVKVVDCCGISSEDLIRYKGRKREYVLAKQVHMAFLHKIFNIRDSLCSSIYGRDRTTCLHACKIIKDLNETNAGFRKQYGDVIDFCMSHDSEKTNDFLKGK